MALEVLCYWFWPKLIHSINCPIIAPNICTACENDRFLKFASCVEAGECGIGYYGNSVKRECQPCPGACRTCDDGEACTACRDDYYLKDGECAATCGQGYYKGNNKCQPCSENCKRCSNDMDCHVCKDSFLLKGESLCYRSIFKALFQNWDGRGGCSISAARLRTTNPFMHCMSHSTQRWSSEIITTLVLIGNLSCLMRIQPVLRQDCYCYCSFCPLFDMTPHSKHSEVIRSHITARHLSSHRFKEK